MGFHQNGRLANLLVLQEHGFDFAGLDAVTTDFDLVVDATDVFDATVLVPSDQVAGAVKAVSVMEGALDETFRRHVGAIQVAPGHAGTADEQFANQLNGHRLHAGVEYVAIGV